MLTSSILFSFTSYQDDTQKAETEAATAKEQYETLKARVKTVATELKERRVECRALNSSIDALSEEKSALESQVEDLRNQVSRHDHSHTEKGAEMDQLREAIKSNKATIADLHKTLKGKEAVGDKALAAYKKKAQASLAEANARAAVANQAREDAELDASAARASVEDALERARVAETRKDDVVAEARKEADDAKAKLEAHVTDMSALQEEHAATKDRLQQLQGAAGSASDTRRKLEEEVDVLTRELASEREKNAVLEQSYNQEQIKSQGYNDEADTLRQELQKTATAALMEREKNSIKNGKSNADGGGSRLSSGKDDGTEGRMTESDAMIVMLQQDLAGANDAIRELKEALGNALINAEGVDMLEATVLPSLQARSFDSAGDASDINPTASGYAASGQGPGAHLPPPAGSSTGENDSTPLYFAMEKQFELNTARDEILRLANLLGDAESEKEAAFEAMDAMRQTMEEAESKLRRYEKLGAGARAQLSSRYSAHDPYGGGYGSSYRGSARLEDTDNTEAEAGPASTAESRTNLEYLKNVMLSYLKARTMAERKALVPVLASVLDFTPDEAYAAMANAEATSGLQGVGASFLETLGSKAHAFI